MQKRVPSRAVARDLSALSARLYRTGLVTTYAHGQEVRDEAFASVFAGVGFEYIVFPRIEHVGPEPIEDPKREFSWFGRVGRVYSYRRSEVLIAADDARVAAD